jgi:hypothetical protein
MPFENFPCRYNHHHHQLETSSRALSRVSTGGLLDQKYAIAILDELVQQICDPRRKFEFVFWSCLTEMDQA